MFGRKRTELIPIPQEEWDFSQIDDPADAEVCLRYELAREVQNPQSYFSAFPNLEAAPFAFYPLPVSGEMAKGTSAEFWQAVKETYVHAVSVPAHEDSHTSKEILAGMYFLHPDQSVRAYPFYLLNTPWRKLDSDWQLQLSLYAEHESTGFFVHGADQIDGWSREPRTLFERLKKPSKRLLFIASVEWAKSNADLVEGFSNWLETTRPKEFPSMTMIGRQSAFDRLNALSALRLRHSLTVEEAVKLTKTTLGKSLYSERPAWERAQKRALMVFRLMYPGAGEPLSADKVSGRKGENKL